MLSTNPTHFTPEKYDDAWERVDLERSYKNLYTELRKELQSSKDTLEDVLNGINQSQDTSGTVRLMNDIVQLRVEKIKLLERLTDLEKKKRDLEKMIDKTEIGNMFRHTRLDEKEDEDKAQLRLLLNQSMDECETLKKRVEYYAEILG
ncbi:unnamed protein product [Alternaria alternata]